MINSIDSGQLESRVNLAFVVVVVVVVAGHVLYPNTPFYPSVSKRPKPS